jgi:hypothetical protein
MAIIKTISSSSVEALALGTGKSVRSAAARRSCEVS